MFRRCRSGVPSDGDHPVGAKRALPAVELHHVLGAIRSKPICDRDDQPDKDLIVISIGGTASPVFCDFRGRRFPPPEFMKVFSRRTLQA